jgi:hypothetical protein
MADEKKSWNGWTRDAAFFTAGAVFGAAAATGAGYATESIRTPEEREAAMKSAALAATPKK